MDVKVIKDKHISRLVDRENFIMTKKVIDRGKRSKILSEVKPVENISKNPQSFPEIAPAQKEVILLHKLQDRAYE